MMNRDQWTIYHAYRAALPVEVRIAVEWSRWADAYVVTMEDESLAPSFHPATIIDLYRGLSPRVQRVPNLRLQEMAEANAAEAPARMASQVASRANEARGLLGDPYREGIAAMRTGLVAGFLPQWAHLKLTGLGA